MENERQPILMWKCRGLHAAKSGAVFLATFYWTQHAQGGNSWCTSHEFASIVWVFSVGFTWKGGKQKPKANKISLLHFWEVCVKYVWQHLLLRNFKPNMLPLWAWTLKLSAWTEWRQSKTENLKVFHWRRCSSYVFSKLWAFCVMFLRF